MTIGEYLIGKVRFGINEAFIAAVALDRDVNDINIEATSFTGEQRDLLYADVLLFAVTGAPTSTGSYSYSDGFTKESFGSESNSNQSDILSLVKSIYSKYGDSLHADLLLSAQDRGTIDSYEEKQSFYD